MNPIQWLSQPIEAFSACLLTNVWLGFPFMMVIALGGLQSIPIELYEAARVDGASRIQQFFKIFAFNIYFIKVDFENKLIFLIC